MNTSISYPVCASDYLDLSGHKGNSSVAGIVDSDNKIIVDYCKLLAYEEAKAVAEAMNCSKSDAILQLIAAGTALETRI